MRHIRVNHDEKLILCLGGLPGRATAFSPERQRLVFSDHCVENDEELARALGPRKTNLIVRGQSLYAPARAVLAPDLQ